MKRERVMENTVQKRGQGSERAESKDDRSREGIRQIGEQRRRTEGGQQKELRAKTT